MPKHTLSEYTAGRPFSALGTSRLLLRILIQGGSTPPPLPSPPPSDQLHLLLLAYYNRLFVRIKISRRLLFIANSIKISAPEFDATDFLIFLSDFVERAAVWSRRGGWSLTFTLPGPHSFQTTFIAAQYQLLPRFKYVPAYN